jgi:hypothetical protein
VLAVNVNTVVPLAALPVHGPCNGNTWQAPLRRPPPRKVSI